MRRLATSALVAALVVAGAAGAQAQDTTGRRASQFDLGIYAGGAYTTDWFQIDGTGYKPGVSGIFGAQATYWLSPSFGVRLHGAYTPQRLPQDDEVFDSDRWLVNTWLYDLDLVWRPLFWSASSPWLSSLYLFAGGGGVTADPAGGPEGVNSCVPVGAWIANGVCVPGNPSFGTVGQGTAGIGIDVVPLGNTFGIFLEGAVHGYDSPAHVFNANEDAADDKFTFTPRLVLGLKAMFGDILPPPPVVVPPPPPVLPPPPVTPPPPPVTTQDINVCVIQSGSLTNVTAQYNTATGDTTYNGGSFSAAFPAGADYAAGATWYINNDEITFNNRTYVKYGLPRVLGVTEVTRSGDYQGVGVFTEAGATGTPEVIYIPVRPGCEFQPYQLKVKTGGVRG
ncbi:MAG TPA: hypothetical protein VFQ39_05810 [Longimicrobium sp.]|nr:hypothetical protein [Longimicrobium sp.]